MRRSAFAAILALLAAIGTAVPVAAAVPWPAVTGTPNGAPILSDRDRTNPTLTELIAHLRG